MPVAAIVAIASALAIATPAAAAPTWLRPTGLTAEGDQAEAPRIALDAAGDATAVWLHFDGANYIVQSAARPAGGSWSAPVDLSAPGEDADAPQVAVDPGGDATAVWTRFNGAETGSNSIVQAASRAPGGSWSAPVDLSLVERNAEIPEVALDAGGDATAVWRRFDGANYIVQSAGRPAGGLWSGPVELSPAGHNTDTPHVALDPAGDATVVWRQLEGSDYVIEGAERPGAGGWSVPVGISASGHSAEAPQVEVDSAGTATAVWSRSNGSNFIVQSSDRPLGGPWSAPADLSGLGKSASSPQVAVDLTGGSAVVWSRSNGGGTTVVQGTTRAPGGSFVAPDDLSALGGAAVTPQVAVNAAGEVAAVWSFSNGTPAVVAGSLKTAAGGWASAGNVSLLGRSSTEPRVSLDPQGNGLAAWVAEEGSERIVQAAGLDGDSPDLLALSVAPAATIHIPAQFSVAPFDVWSPIKSISWSFDDEAGAEGPTAGHTFSSVGIHEVTVVATDALGNLTSATRQVTVFRGAHAGHNAFIGRGGAQLKLHCPSPAGCEGRMRLYSVARILRDGHVAGRRLQIGSAAFRIPGKEVDTVAVPLSKKGVQLVRQAGPKGLKAQLLGPGIRHRLVVLLVRR